MAGNVSEWVMDNARMTVFYDFDIFFEDSLRVKENDDLQSAYEKVVKRYMINNPAPDTTTESNSDIFNIYKNLYSYTKT